MVDQLHKNNLHTSINKTRRMDIIEPRMIYTLNFKCLTIRCVTNYLYYTLFFHEVQLQSKNCTSVYLWNAYITMSNDQFICDEDGRRLVIFWLTVTNVCDSVQPFCVHRVLSDLSVVFRIKYLVYFQKTFFFFSESFQYCYLPINF